MGKESQTWPRRIAAGLCATVISALGSYAIALGATRTVGHCSFRSPQKDCNAQAYMKNKPKAIVIHASASPGQVFRVPYRVFCQAGGGEGTFAKQDRHGQSTSGSFTKVIRIPKRARTSHCTAAAAIFLQGGSGGSGQLTLKERT